MQGHDNKDLYYLHYIQEYCMRIMKCLESIG